MSGVTWTQPHQSMGLTEQVETEGTQMPDAGQYPLIDDETLDGAMLDAELEEGTGVSNRPLLNAQMGSTDTTNKFNHKPPPQTQEEVGFPQFAKLPTELRRKIWRATWEDYDITVTRKTTGYCGTRLEEAYKSLPETAVHRIKSRHIRLVCYKCEGLDPPDDDLPDAYPVRHICTHTSASRSGPPLSLWINQESRDETMLYFQPAFSLPFGTTSLYFDFNFNGLHFPLHKPLLTAFTKPDLKRLRRITIPELTPMLCSFVSTVLWPPRTRTRPLLPVEGEKDSISHRDFTLSWRLLQKWFPNLREITFTRFGSCERYENTAKVQSQTLLEINELVACDNFCWSCLWVQRVIRQIFRTPDDSQDYADSSHLRRFFEYHGLWNPKYTQKKMVIGTMPAKREGEAREEVVVYYEMPERRTTGSFDIHPLIMALNQTDTDQDSESQSDDDTNTLNPEYIARKCIRTNLEHTLGIPISVDYMTYHC
ncbi:hypothetical protein F5Y15DRAFT_427669 [Xylariaceae sp. FL0016]|nr:hypothetical protein F5Y15DRAFT_427669 [Xylariaceae sp. FL0016]